MSPTYLVDIAGEITVMGRVPARRSGNGLPLFRPQHLSNSAHKGQPGAPQVSPVRLIVNLSPLGSEAAKRVGEKSKGRSQSRAERLAETAWEIN
nr:hypothetical protein L204_01744 [Cryptococcus depauperatus CBS 7855]